MSSHRVHLSVVGITFTHWYSVSLLITGVLWDGPLAHQLKGATEECHIIYTLTFIIV